MKPPRPAAPPVRLAADVLDTPIGRIWIACSPATLCMVDFDDYDERMRALLTRRFGSVDLVRTPDPLGVTARLAQYFQGDLEALDPIPVDPGGTPYQQRVWSEMRRITPGATRSYGELAARLGATHARAIGHASSLNPIAIVVPCHRVIGADAALTGYAGGLHRKRGCSIMKAPARGSCRFSRRGGVGRVNREPTGQMRSMQAILIGNARSSHSRLFMEAHQRLVARGVDVDEAHVAADAGETKRYVKRAIRAGRELIVVAGGDGTMTKVVGAFAHTEAILGVLPLGTGNSFARSLGILPELETAVDAIAGGATRRVDLGRVNKTYFANFSTLGLSADISGATSSRLKDAIGAAAYAVAGIRPLLTHQPFNCRIRWGKNRLDVRTHQIIVANGRFFGDTPILPDATIDDGELALFTTTGTSTWDVAKSFFAMLAGKQIDLRDAHYFSAPKITIKTSPRVALAIDGDVLGRTPARFSVARRALRVMVPQ